MLRTVCKHAFWGKALTIIVSSTNLNGYYFLTRICNIMCSEQCAILVQIYILSILKSDWMTKYDNFSSQISFVKNKIISSLLRTFFSQNIYLRCNKINLGIILRSQYSRKKSDWYCMILGLSRRLYNIIIEHNKVNDNFTASFLDK